GAQVEESLNAIRTVQAYTHEGHERRRFADRVEAAFAVAIDRIRARALLTALVMTSVFGAVAVVLWVGGREVLGGGLSGGELSQFVFFAVVVAGAVGAVSEVYGDLQRAAGATERLLELLAVESDVAAPATPEPLPEPAEGALGFDGVTFHYPSRPDSASLSGIDLAVAPGERVALVGPSGAGKTTVFQLLLRFYDPLAGSVTLDGIDVKRAEPRSLRERFALVAQEPVIFSGNAWDNIRYGRPEASDDEVREAARAAAAEGFLDALPEGFSTFLGERGVRLSGGQRQRIAIARALLHDAPFLVLDEALSAVDAENEAVIQQALDRLMKGRTVLILAHRLSSVIGADRILVLEEGALVEQGGHQALMAGGGVYARLMAAQAAESTADAKTDAAPPLTSAAAAAPLEDMQLARTQPADEILRAGHMGWWRAAGLLMRLVRPLRKRVALAFTLGVARVMALIGVGVLSAFVVAAVRHGEPFGGLLIALYALAPFAGILHWLESWVAHDMAFRLLSEMRIALFAKLDALAPAYLLRRRSGDLVAMATQDIENVEFFFAHTVAPAFVALLVPAAVLGALLWYGWPLALALAPFLALIAVSPFLMRKRVDRLASRASEAQGELNAHTVDTLQGLPEILAFRQEARRGAQLIALVRRHHALRLPFFRDLTIQTALVETVTGLGGLAMVISGAALVNSGDLERTALPLLTLLAMAAFLPVSEIANIGRQLADTLGGTRRLNAVHSEPVAVRDGPGVAPSSGAGAPALELEDVRFTYPGIKAPALVGVNLSLAAGSTLALVGPSGAGKTTLAHLLMRFWDPEQGTVRLGGHDLKEWRLDDLSRHIALVAQDTYLFNDTIRANILIARPEASAAELAAAVSHAALDDFTAALPDGLDTEVGERGTRLSGGQRQRIAIARAFLKDAPVLILDEATSHLDALNEQAVRRALDALMVARTTIVIAHRLSTVRDADQILVMDEGRVCEAGDHAGLLAKGGLYAALAARQLAANAQSVAD
ncbi:MAG: thiol reductant ABC exporter subunit CydC, partial [Alphaproteobacteria bacterium]|nr:thiol reductant ABC exporter subunit CydC [Alphaproteobacteria bacterium]